MQFSNITLALMKGNLKEICQVLSSVPWNFTNGCKSQCNPNKYTIMDNTAFSFNPLKYMSEFLQYINRMGVCSCCWRVFFFFLFLKLEKKQEVYGLVPEKEMLLTCTFSVFVQTDTHTHSVTAMI